MTKDQPILPEPKERGLKVYGCPVEQLNRENLIRATYMAVGCFRSEIKMHEETTKFMEDIIKTK